MATEPDRRGQGLAGQVLEAAAGYAGAHGAELLWCSARDRAVPFYARHGFAQHGAIFMDARAVPHRLMARELFAVADSST